MIMEKELEAANFLFLVLLLLLLNYVAEECPTVYFIISLFQCLQSSCIMEDDIILKTTLVIIFLKFILGYGHFIRAIL